MGRSLDCVRLASRGTPAAPPRPLARRSLSPDPQQATRGHWCTRRARVAARHGPGSEGTALGGRSLRERRFAPEMTARGSGSIINLGSWVARLGIPVGALYASTKGAMETLTRAWAAEFGSPGVSVNALRENRERQAGARGRGRRVPGGGFSSWLWGPSQVALQVPALLQPFPVR